MRTLPHWICALGAYRINCFGAADGTDTKAKEIAGPLGLSVRGMGGEHTPIGADGTVDISPRARFCITEAQIIAALYEGIKQLKEAEDVEPEREPELSRS